MLLPLAMIIFNYKGDMIQSFNRYTEPYSRFQYSSDQQKPKEIESDSKRRDTMTSKIDMDQLMIAYAEEDQVYKYGGTIYQNTIQREDEDDMESESIIL